MIVALTSRHFRDLTELTGTANAVAALANTLDADFTDEGERYRHRDALTGLFAELVRRAHGLRGDRGAVGIVCPVGALPHLRRSGRPTNGDGQPDVHPTHQPRIGEYLAPGLPVVDQRRLPGGGPAPALGDDTGGVLAEWLGLSESISTG